MRAAADFDTRQCHLTGQPLPAQAQALVRALVQALALAWRAATRIEALPLA